MPHHIAPTYLLSFLKQLYKIKKNTNFTFTFGFHHLPHLQYLTPLLPGLPGKQTCK